MKVLTIIPARGGSKGVPRKNVRVIAGKPLIAWTILSAKKSKYAQNCFVSTEDTEIARVSAEFGVPVIRRPHNLADDMTPMCDVVKHALQTCEAIEGGTYTYVLLLQPTSPLRTNQDIDNSIQTLIDSSADSVISVTEYEGVHPSKMYTLRDGYLNCVAENLHQSRRQDLASIYRRNGAIFACTRELFQNKNCLWGEKIVSYVMPKNRSVDIDNSEDLDLAEFYIKLRT